MVLQRISQLQYTYFKGESSAIKNRAQGTRQNIAFHMMGRAYRYVSYLVKSKSEIEKIHSMLENDFYYLLFNRLFCIFYILTSEAKNNTLFAHYGRLIFPVIKRL